MKLIELKHADVRDVILNHSSITILPSRSTGRAMRVWNLFSPNVLNLYNTMMSLWVSNHLEY